MIKVVSSVPDLDRIPSWVTFSVRERRGLAEGNLPPSKVLLRANRVECRYVPKDLERDGFILERWYAEKLPSRSGASHVHRLGFLFSLATRRNFAAGRDLELLRILFGPYGWFFDAGVFRNGARGNYPENLCISLSGHPVSKVLEDQAPTGDLRIERGTVRNVPRDD